MSVSFDQMLAKKLTMAYFKSLTHSGGETQSQQPTLSVHDITLIIAFTESKFVKYFDKIDEHYSRQDVPYNIRKEIDIIFGEIFDWSEPYESLLLLTTKTAILFREHSDRYQDHDLLILVNLLFKWTPQYFSDIFDDVRMPDNVLAFIVREYTHNPDLNFEHLYITCSDSIANTDLKERVAVYCEKHGLENIMRKK